MSYILGIFCIFLLVRISNLSSRLDRLEAKLFLNKSKELEDFVSEKVEETQDSIALGSSSTYVEGYSNSTYSTTSELEDRIVEHKTDSDDVLNRFVSWLKENWLMKLGGFIIMLGALFFLSIAFENMTDQAKIMLGYVSMIVVISFGYFWLSRSRDAGSVLIAMGAGLGIFSTFAAAFVYKIYDAGTGTVISIVIAALVACIAYYKNIKNLSILALILAAISPAIFNYVKEEALLILVYVLVLSLLCVIVDYKKSWMELPLISFVAFVLYSLYVLLYQGDMYALLVTFGQVALIIAYTLRRLSVNRLLDELDLGLMGLTVLYSLFAIYSAATESTITFIIMLLAVCFGGLAVIINNFANTNNQSGVIVYSAAAVIYTFIATARLLDGPALTIAFIIEGLVVTIGVHLITKNLNKTLIASTTTLLGVFLSFWHLINDSINVSASVVALQTVSLLVMGTYLYFDYKEEKERDVIVAYPIIAFALVISFLLKISDEMYDINFLIVSSLIVCVLFFIYSNYLLKDKVIRAIAYIGVLFNYLAVFGLLLEDASKEAVDYNLYSIMILVLVTLVSLTYIYKKETKKDSFVLAYAGAGLMVAYFIWQFLHKILEDGGVATFVALIIYSVVGYILLFISNLNNINNSDTYKKLGQLILCLVGVRVIFIDAWQYSTSIAVLICMGVGAILVATMFITNNKINILK